MGKCKVCGRSLPFFSFTSGRICKKCRATIFRESKHRAAVIQRYVDEIADAETVSAKLRGYKVLLLQARALLAYENLGITTVYPPPSRMLAMYGPIYARLEEESKGTTEGATDQAQNAA